MREKDRMEKDVSNSLLLSVNQLMSNGTVLETREQLEQSIFTDTLREQKISLKRLSRIIIIGEKTQTRNSVHQM